MSVCLDAQFLGSTVLNRQSSATGLGALQQPLIELYATSFQPTTGAPCALPLSRLTVTERGMIVTTMDPSCLGDQDTFYSMPSIMFWEAVRFTSVRINDKKYRGAFEPIGGNKLAKDSLHTDLEKKCFHLAKKVKQHPVLVVFVLRRTTGVKALEVQAYAFGSAREAAFIVENLSAAQQSYGAQQAMASNVFSYNAFESNDVRPVAGGMQVINTVSPTGGYRMANDLRRPPSTVSAAPGHQQLQQQYQDRAHMQRQRHTYIGIPEQADPASFTQSSFELSSPPVHPHHPFMQDDQMRAAPAQTRNPTADMVGPAGGMMEGYYDMPPAIPLPILAQQQQQQPAANMHLLREPASVPIDRSQIFRDTPSIENSSVLHRPLIQRSVDDGTVVHSGTAAVRRNPSFGGEPKSSSNGSAPGPPVKRPTRPASSYQQRSLATSQPDAYAQYNQPPGGGVRGKPQPPQQQQQQQLSRMEPRSGLKSVSEVDEGSESVPFDHMFDFDAAPAVTSRPEHTYANTSSESSADNKPVAMVQPRKVAGVRVLPINMLGEGLRTQLQHVSLKDPQSSKAARSSSSSSQPEGEESRPEATPSDQRRTIYGAAAVAPIAHLPAEADAVERGSNSKEKQDGILNLRTVRGGNATSAPAASNGGGSSFLLPKPTDFNGNNLQLPSNSNYGNSPSPNKPAASNQMLSSSSPFQPANNFDMLRSAAATTAGGAGDGGYGYGEPSKQRSAPVAAPMTPGYSDGHEDMTSKDKEIASAFGNMKIDYEPSAATLTGNGNNFEKYLGYLP